MGSQGLATLNLSEDSTSGAAGGVSVRRLTLTDFRCYRHLRLNLEASPVVLTGPNGSGKTNLLEGLSFLVPGRGLRRARLADVVRREKGAENGDPDSPLRPPSSAWGVAATMMTPAGEVEIGTALEKAADGKRDKRLVKIDGETEKSQAALAEHVGALWLTPQMDRLFVEGPGARRRFLARLVFDTDPCRARQRLRARHAGTDAIASRRRRRGGMAGDAGRHAGDPGRRRRRGPPRRGVPSRPASGRGRGNLQSRRFSRCLN